MATATDRLPLEGKHALVVGGAGSIGLDLIRVLQHEGAQVTCADIIEPAQGKDIVGDNVRYLQCDATDQGSVRTLFRALTEEGAAPTCAAHVLGIVGSGDELTDLDTETWTKVIAVNLTAVMLLLRQELPLMRAEGGGAIVNFASIAGYNGERRRAAYVAAKAGVIGLTKTAALENAAAGVRVNAVVPGPVGNNLFYENVGGRGSPTHRAVEAAIPMGRVAEVREIANAAAWLLSDNASFVTGHTLVVDGGFSAQ